MHKVKIKYNNVQESFGMGGPYLGKLELNGVIMKGQFLADSEKTSFDGSKLIFSRYLGERTGGFLQSKSTRDFRIFLYDIEEDKYFQSIRSYENLAIEGMHNNEITFHRAFHLDFDDDRDSIDFSKTNFEEITIG